MEVKQAERWIYSMVSAHDSEVAAVCISLFRLLARNSHIDKHRNAMSALCDIIEDFAGDV